MSDVGGFSAQTGGTYEDFLASTDHHATASSSSITTHSCLVMFLNEEFPELGRWRKVKHHPAELQKDPYCSVACSPETQSSSMQDQWAAAGLLARVKPSNSFWTSFGPGKGLAALQGTIDHLVFLERAGSTWTAYLSHNPDKPSRIIEILQYVTYKSKFSYSC